MTPGRISDPSLLRLPFHAKLVELLNRLGAEGIPILVFETIRSPDRQLALYAIGRDPDAVTYGRTVTDAGPYQSAHQYGLGADLVFFVRGQWTWVEPQPGMWDRMHVLAAEVKLVTLRKEMPHVQMPGFDFRKLRPGPPDTGGWLAWLRSGALPPDLRDTHGDVRSSNGDRGSLGLGEAGHHRLDRPAVRDEHPRERVSVGDEPPHDPVRG